jgi:hypothetical protein
MLNKCNKRSYNLQESFSNPTSSLRANVEEQHSYRFNKNRRPNNMDQKAVNPKMNPLKHEIEEARRRRRKEEEEEEEEYENDEIENDAENHDTTTKIKENKLMKTSLCVFARNPKRYFYKENINEDEHKNKPTNEHGVVKDYTF